MNLPFEHYGLVYSLLKTHAFESRRQHIDNPPDAE